MASLIDIGPDAQELSKGWREEREELHQQMVAIVRTAKDEKRLCTADELDKLDKMHERFDELNKNIEAIERAEKDLVRSDAFNETKERHDWEHKKHKDDNAPTARDFDFAYRGFLLAGTPHQRPEFERAIKKCGMKVVAGGEQSVNFDMPAISEMRGSKNWDALRRAREFGYKRAQDVVTTRATTAQTITTTGGGNLIGDDNSMIAQLQEHLLLNGTLRELATVVQTDSGGSMPVPGFGGNQSGVNTAINTDVATSDASFSQQTLGRKKYGSLIKLPVELITDAAIDIQGWSGRELGRRLNRVQEQEFATGAATLSECEGVLTTGSSGGAAAGSVAQSSAGNITYADLNSLVHDVDPNFRVDSQWVWHDSVQENVVSQLDSDGHPIFRAGVLVGEPNTVMGYGVSINNLYPAFTGATTNESSKLMSFGRHADYMIRDVRGVSIQVLRERYAETGQVGVLGWAQSDGQYINPHGGSSLSSIKYMAETSS